MQIKIHKSLYPFSYLVTEKSLLWEKHKFFRIVIFYRRMLVYGYIKEAVNSQPKDPGPR